MRENKEKTVTSGDEDVAAPTGKVASVQAGKRKSKSISSAVDLDDLPSRRGPKKQKPGKTSPPKVPKFTPPTVNLDDPLMDVELVQTIHLVQTNPPPPPKASRKPGLSEPSDRPPIWFWTRVMHVGRSKGSSLSMKLTNATTCQ